MELYVIKWLDTGDISARGFKSRADVCYYLLNEYVRDYEITPAVLESLFCDEYIEDFAAYYRVDVI